MKKPRIRILALVLCLALALVTSAFAAEGAPPEGMAPPDGMAPPPGGGPGGGDGAPAEAAIVITGGAENTEAEYESGAWSDSIVQEDSGDLTLEDLVLHSGDYTFNGVTVTGPESRVHLKNASIHLTVDTPAAGDDKGGNAINVDDGAILYLSDSNLVVDGAGRYVTANFNDGTLVVNDSLVQSTGNCDNTADIAEPFSNEALLISGTARANFSVGATKTYYFNSTCDAEGWAALSTDSATGDGLNLYAYNTDGIAENGGYGTYADTNCRVWLYGSRLTAAEIGCIISKSGEINAMPSGDAPREVMEFNEGETVETDSIISGGRNAVMIHAPDMMGQGLYAADCGSFQMRGGTLETTKDLVSSKDYNDYGKAVGAYIDYVSGSDILIRSTSAYIDLDGVDMESYSGTLIHTVLNADSMGNFLDAGDGDVVNPVSVNMTDMDVAGDIRHEDYQRRMEVTLRDTTLTGKIISGTMESWNERWAGYGAVNWVVDESFDAVYGVNLTMNGGSVWNVTGTSSLTSLTVEEDAVLNGTVTLDGAEITPESGKNYQGSIIVSGDYVPPEEAAEALEAEEPAEESVQEIPDVIIEDDFDPQVPPDPAEADGGPEAEDHDADTPEPEAAAEGHRGLVAGGIAVVIAAAAAACGVVLHRRKRQ